MYRDFGKHLRDCPASLHRGTEHRPDRAANAPKIARKASYGPIEFLLILS
jgi:hypothetical protein